MLMANLTYFFFSSTLPRPTGIVVTMVIKGISERPNGSTGVMMIMVVMVTLMVTFVVTFVVIMVVMMVMVIMNIQWFFAEQTSTR